MKTEYKDYIIKHKRHIKISAVIVGIIIFLFIALLLLLKINFMIGEQLRMTLTPEYSEKNSSSPNNVSLGLDVKLYNKFVCVAVCNFTLTDLSHNMLLYNGSFNSKAYKNKHQSFDISIKDYGYGTNIYLYTVECVNIKTTFCPSTDDALVRKSLLAVNYEPSIEQTSSLNYSLEKYLAISKNIVDSSIMLREIDKVTSLVNISFDTQNYSATKSNLELLNKDVGTMLTIWRTSDYSTVKKFIITKNLVDRSNSIKTNALAYVYYLNNTINEHNSLIIRVKEIHSSLEDYRSVSLNIVLPRSAPLFYPGMNYTSQISVISSFNASLRKNMLDSIVAGNTIIDNLNIGEYIYAPTYFDTLQLDTTINNLNPNIINATLLRLSEQSPAIYIYSNMLCIINNTIKNNISANNFVTDDICNDYYASGTGHIVINLQNISEASLSLDRACTRSRIIVNNSIDWNSEENYANTNSSANYSLGESGLSINDSLETLLLQYKLLIDYESANINNAGYPRVVMALYKNYIQNSLIRIYNISNPEELLQEHTFNSSLLTFSKNNIILSDVRYINESCRENPSYLYYNNDATLITYPPSHSNNIPYLSDITFSKYIMPVINFSDSSDISTIMPPDIVRQCCMYTMCQSCEKKSSKNPLILLHGHSFNFKTNAYQSIEIFDNFEKKFSEDKLYYLSGIPIPGKDVTFGILGNYYIPMISKPTYYVETYNDLLGLTSEDSKKDNIDTYALRLSESIDYTLQITGSNKVDIVAHSMGGLVLRRYTQIFGTTKLGKVILIATPNKGISDSKYTLCKIFGSVTECDNMRTDGIFIKKLNDFSNQPIIDNLYLVIGRGCDTDSGDGDGVVLVNNSLLPNVPERNILYVDGKCSGTKLLHNDLLNIAEYPQVYNFVKSKLE